MPSKCKKDFEIFNGTLKGKYEAGVTYPQDRLAQKYPHDFELTSPSVADVPVFHTYVPEEVKE